MRSSWFSSVCRGECRDSTSNYIRTDSFYSLSNPLPIYHVIIRLHITWATEIVVKYTKNKEEYAHAHVPSQWPCGLRHELSSPSRMLGSWVRIPLKAWMSVCAFILCLCCPVCR
jgi:hypothetical protein